MNNIIVRIYSPYHFFECTGQKVLVPGIDGPALITNRHIKNYSYPLKGKKIVIDDVEYLDYAPLICNVSIIENLTVVEICCKK